VDRERCIIRGVKILGEQSANGRIYTPESRLEAWRDKLYEGIAVYVDHPANPNDPRPVRSKFGRLVNIRMIEGFPYGDLEYLKSHPDAELICEAAERMPEQFGLSHNAVGEGPTDEDGIMTVERIVEVRSVDVVTEPATTGGFFEHKGNKPVTIKIKQLFENSWKKYARRVTKRPRLGAYLKALIEEDDQDLMDEDVPAAAEEVPADSDEALSSGFKAAVSAIVDECLANPGSHDECVKKIVKLLKAHTKLTAEPDQEEGDLEEEEEEPVTKKEEAEEQRQRLQSLERENLIYREASKLGIQPDDVLMESLMDARDDKRVKKLLEREKERAGKGANPPRSGAGGDGNSKPVLEGVDTNEGFLAALLG